MELNNSKIKIKSKNLNVYYGNKQALHNINLEINNKEVTALIGPSGCGKSTFIRCINRMNDTIDICKVDGSIEIDGKEVNNKNVDVVLVAPKGAGNTVRNHFVNGGGINASYAIHQDYSGKAKENTLALAFAIGCGHAFETTFEKEVYSDLTGERCVLMGLIQGAFLAQYKVLRENGHSPSEAYNETVEEALESLFPLISEKGMDWLYSNCSTTAQRGALDWAPKFEKVLKPVIEDCYSSVKCGIEADVVIFSNSTSDYREKLNKELEEIDSQELWQTAKVLRNLRP